MSESAEMRDTFWGRFRGLMLSTKKDVILSARDEGIASSAIHMCFVLYPIDVVWVNRDMKVVDVKRVRPLNPLKPETVRVHSPKKPAKYVVELAVGKAGETKEWDKIEFN